MRKQVLCDLAADIPRLIKDAHMKKLIGTATLLLLAACRGPAAEPAAPAATTTQEDVATTVMPATPTPVAAPAAAAAPDPAPVPVPAPIAAGDLTAVNQSIDDLLGDHERYQAVIQQFQKAVADKDAATVASLVEYPFTATIDGKRVKIANGDAFVQQYEKIVTPAIANVITQQKYSELMVNYKGVMFGSGEAWINGICKDKACQKFDVRVVAIQPTS
jgi:predicted lipid-binding transport protein (Tim44 family)